MNFILAIAEVNIHFILDSDCIHIDFDWKEKKYNVVKE